MYEILWQPLDKELSGIKTIYFSPSGLLHRINLDAIPISETETLADRYNLIEVNSTRQLVVPSKVKITNNDAVLFGEFNLNKIVHYKIVNHYLHQDQEENYHFNWLIPH